MLAKQLCDSFIIVDLERLKTNGTFLVRTSFVKAKVEGFLEKPFFILFFYLAVNFKCSNFDPLYDQLRLWKFLLLLQRPE